MMLPSEPAARIRAALDARRSLLRPGSRQAWRLFNGFTEGWPQLSVDLYADTLLVQDYADVPLGYSGRTRAVVDLLVEHVAGVRAAVLKIRNSNVPAERRGLLVAGDLPAEQIEEAGLRYAIDLTIGKDASFYLDTRRLRAWLQRQSEGRSVLNAFAYTGSLGVAAVAGGARRVVQVDRNPRHLEIAKRSSALNGFAVRKGAFVRADFFHQTAAYRKSRRQFGCIVVDPPFFASSATGVIDLEREAARLLRKVQPLVEPGGFLIAVNNALFTSGATYMGQLEALCSDGYLEMSEVIPVPEDFIGYPSTRTGKLPADPAPFNHSTKIAVLHRTE